MLSCQVEDDKAQITAVIQQLDEKKRIALEETWKHVSTQPAAVLPIRPLVYFGCEGLLVTSLVCLGENYCTHVPASAAGVKCAACKNMVC